MKPEYKAIFDMIKDIAAMFAIPVGLFAIIVNWRTLFAPYQKKLKDEQFDTVKHLVTSLIDPRFIIFYKEPLSDTSIAFAKSAVLSDYYSPFLPESLRQPVWQYITFVYKTLKDDSQKPLFRDQHRNLYRRAVTLLGAKGSTFPNLDLFLEPPSGHGSGPGTKD